MTKQEQEKILYTLHKYKEFGLHYLEPLNFDLPHGSIVDLPHTNQELSEYINHCSLCELSKLSYGKTVGIGDYTSSIYFIGTNIEFGNKNIYKLLKDIIEKVLLLETNKIYITNIVKCNCNTKASKKLFSIESCKSYILQQLELNKPKYIITFGDAYNYIMKSDDAIFDIRGNQFTYKQSTVIPLMDIEFVYKNPSYKNDMYEDLQKIKKMIGV